MAEIAYLAHVERPTVTMWRKRFAAGLMPFPAPTTTAPTERFSTDEVADWLAQTGHGNNPDLSTELAALELWALGDGSEEFVEKLSSWLTVAALYGLPDPVCDDPDYADEGPDSAYEDWVRQLYGDWVAGLSGVNGLAGLFGEGLYDATPTFVRRLTAFVDAHPGCPAAHDVLMELRFRQASAELAASSIMAPLARLIAQLVVSLGAPGVIDENDNGFDWIRALPENWEGGLASLRLPDTSRGSMSQRIALLRGFPIEADSGGFVRVAMALDAESDPNPASEDGLTIVIAPARLLCDPLPDPQWRDEMLRESRVLAIVKLPAGLRYSKRREQLAIMLIGQSRESDPDARVAVGDLSGITLDDAVIGPLAHDFAAASTGLARDAHHRAWRYLRPMRARSLVARGGSLVAPPVAESDAPAEEVAIDLHQLAAKHQVMSSLRWSVPKQATYAAVTLHDAVSRGWVRMLPGTRLDPAQLQPGNLATWVVDAALGRGPSVDALTTLSRRRLLVTEPGDVVYHQPAAPAFVDHQGGSVVCYPARVVRVLPTGPLVPAAIARAISTSPKGSKPGNWAVGTVSAQGRRGLAAASAEIEARRSVLRTQLAELDDLEQRLITAAEHHLIDIVEGN